MIGANPHEYDAEPADLRWTLYTTVSYEAQSMPFPIVMLSVLWFQRLSEDLTGLLGVATIPRLCSG
jgi:hypothetical protein